MSDQDLLRYEDVISSVMDWVNGTDWMETCQAHVEEFFQGLSDAIGAPSDEILGQLPVPFWTKALSCTCEDFLTNEYESTPPNAVDQYLDEEGASLEEADVEFLRAFRSSVVRIYHVVERTPYESVVLRDISGGQRTLTVPDVISTATLSAGDHIATRIVSVGEQDILAGTVLVLSAEVLEMFKQAFEETFRNAMKEVEKYLQKDVRQRNRVRAEVERGSAAAIAGLWVAGVIEALAGAPPFATDGDPETLFRAIVPFTCDLEPVVACLDGHADLERLISKEFFWLWRREGKGPDDSLKALVWISGSDICLESCEESRTQEAVAILGGLLGDSLGEATIQEIEDLDDVDLDFDSDEFDEVEDEE